MCRYEGATGVVGREKAGERVAIGGMPWESEAMWSLGGEERPSEWRAVGRYKTSCFPVTYLFLNENSAPS